jgi:hypothetical protein
MTQPPDAQLPQSPSNNKAVGSAIGGTLAASAAWVTVLVVHSYWWPTLSPETASGLVGAFTVILGTVGTFFAPLLTAAQQAAIHKLQGR